MMYNKECITKNTIYAEMNRFKFFYVDEMNKWDESFQIFLCRWKKQITAKI
jgi:hypothetical protein